MATCSACSAPATASATWPTWHRQIAAVPPTSPRSARRRSSASAPSRCNAPRPAAGTTSIGPSCGFSSSASIWPTGGSSPPGADMDRIGKYEIRRKLGAGATSTVYLGYDSFSQREVAIKLIDPEVLKDAHRGRLFRHLVLNEASLAGKLVHPHIVQIYDAVIDDERSYIVMEYAPGGTLEPFCRPDNLLPLDRLVEIVFKCTRALDYAFRAGITHRDIKPANILLAHPLAEGGASADIKISDFGAALDSRSEQTRTQVSGVGSPAYMSPQQVREMPLDHQTDIYSLGVVMFQLLTGRLPFQAGNSYSMVYQILNIEVPPPSAFRTDIPASLDAIVARFSDVEIWEVVRLSRWQALAAGTTILKDGEPGDFFCFLCVGELSVSKRGHTLDLLAPGACFGEMAVIGRNRSRDADVVAQTASRVVSISAEALESATDACRMHFYEAFLDVLTGRLAA